MLVDEYISPAFAVPYFTDASMVYAMRCVVLFCCFLLCNACGIRSLQVLHIQPARSFAACLLLADDLCPNYFSVCCRGQFLKVTDQIQHDMLSADALKL